VDLVGGAEREIQIAVDATKLAAYSLSINDVIQAVASSNLEIPAGNLTQGPRQILLRTMGKYSNVNDFNRVIVATPGGKPVYLSDIAQVVDGVKEQTSLTRVNGKQAVALASSNNRGATRFASHRPYKSDKAA